MMMLNYEKSSLRRTHLDSRKPLIQTEIQTKLELETEGFLNCDRQILSPPSSSSIASTLSFIQTTNHQTNLTDCLSLSTSPPPPRSPQSHAAQFQPQSPHQLTRSSTTHLPLTYNKSNHPTPSSSQFRRKPNPNSTPQFKSSIPRPTSLRSLTYSTSMTLQPPPRLSSRSNSSNNNTEPLPTNSTSLPIRQRAQSAQSHAPSILNLKPFNQASTRSRPSLITQPNSSTPTLNRSGLSPPPSRFTNARLTSQSFKLNDEPHQDSNLDKSSPSPIRKRTQTLTSIPIPKQTFRTNPTITPQRSRTRLTPSRSTSTSPLPPRTVRSPNPTITSDDDLDVPLRKSLPPRTNSAHSSTNKKSSSKPNSITNTNVQPKSKSTTYLPQTNTEPLRLKSPDSNPLNVEISKNTESSYSAPDIPLQSDPSVLRCQSIPEVTAVNTNRQSILKSSISSVNKIPNHFDLPIDDRRKQALHQIITSMGHESFTNLIDQFKLHELLSQRYLYHTQQQIQSRLAFIQPDLFSPQPELFSSQNFEVNENPTLESKLMLATSPHLNYSPPINQQTSSSKRSGSSSTLGNTFLEKFRTKLNSKNLLGNKARNKKLSGTSSSQLFSPTSSFNQTSSLEKISLSFPRSSTTQEKHQSQILGAQLESMNKSTCVITIGSSLHVLPTLPFMVIEEIYRRGMHTIGILRITGDFNRIDSLMQLFQTCAQPDLSQEDIHTLAGTLKQFLRALPDPIFHPVFFEALWSTCQSSSTDETNPKSIELVSNFLRLLPTRSLSLLIYLISFLSKIPQFPENRIQFDSISLIFGPTIFLSRQIGLPGLGLNSYSASLGEGLLIETKKSRDCLFWLLVRWDEILKCVISNEHQSQKQEFFPKKAGLGSMDDSLIYSSGDENLTQSQKDEEIEQSPKPFTWINLDEVQKTKSIMTDRSSKSTVEFTTSTIHQQLERITPDKVEVFDGPGELSNDGEKKVKLKRNSSLDSNIGSELNMKLNSTTSTNTTNTSTSESETNPKIHPILESPIKLDEPNPSTKINEELIQAFRRIEELENQVIELNESRKEEIKRREAIEVEFERVLGESNRLKEKLESIQTVLGS